MTRSVAPFTIQHSVLLDMTSVDRKCGGLCDSIISTGSLELLCLLIKQALKGSLSVGVAVGSELLYRSWVVAFNNAISPTY